jgi:rhodanese-related sulfurtransferase
VPARASFLAFAIAAVVHAACGPGTSVTGDARAFDEIDIPAATRSVEHDDARLVQVRAPGSGEARVTAAIVVGPADPVPDEWLRGGRPIVVIAADAAAARRLAARLLRLGAIRVSVVRGGIEDWLEQPAPATDPDARVGLRGSRDAKQPSGPETARRIDPWQQSQK